MTSWPGAVAPFAPPLHTTGPVHRRKILGGSVAVFCRYLGKVICIALLYWKLYIGHSIVASSALILMRWIRTDLICSRHFVDDIGG